MTRNHHCPPRLSWIFQDVVAADNSINDESCFCECPNNAPAVDGRQPCGGHAMRPPLRGELRDEHRGDRNSIIASIGEDGADRLLRIGECFALCVAFRDDFRKSRHKHGEAATFLRFKNDREAVGLRHGVPPSVYARSMQYIETPPWPAGNMGPHSSDTSPLPWRSRRPASSNSSSTMRTTAGGAPASRTRSSMPTGVGPSSPTMPAR